jgi:signal transduction histidine kinase/DNA-binding response OmpR family regulator
MNDKPIKVLLIEDNPGDARLIQELLREAATARFELLHVERLAAGLERLGEEKFDVLLLDLGLPDSQGPDVPIVLLTALDDKAFALEAVRQGAQDYLVKGQVDGNLLIRALCYAIERKRVEEALQRRNRELALLNQVGQELAVTLDPQQVTEQLLREVTEIIGAERASAWLWDEGPEDWLVCRAASHHDPGRSPINMRLRPGQGVASWVVQSGKSVIVPYAPGDSRFFAGIDEQTGFRTISLLAVPLWVRGKVIGVLEVVNKRKDAPKGHYAHFDEADLALVETLAASAAIAIDNARLVEMQRQQTAELQMRNEELDAFAHTVAHDLRGPLGHMVGFAHVLAKDHAELPDEELRGYLCTIARSGHKMSNIIDALLLLAGVHKMGEVEMGPLDMYSIVAEVQERLAFMVEEHRAEIMSPPEGAWPVALGYGPWVEEVWANYLSNAIKYGGRPPRVELGADPPFTSPPQAGGSEGGLVRFWVRDNGPGLTPEERARLFKPFTRVNQVCVKGHGLGLSVVLRVVRKLGGQVGVESQVGHGSVFSFTLPTAEPR